MTPASCSFDHCPASFFRPLQKETQQNAMTKANQQQVAQKGAAFPGFNGVVQCCSSNPLKYYLRSTKLALILYSVLSVTSLHGIFCTSQRRYVGHLGTTTATLESDVDPNNSRTTTADPNSPTTTGQTMTKAATMENYAPVHDPNRSWRFNSTLPLTLASLTTSRKPNAEPQLPLSAKEPKVSFFTSTRSMHQPDSMRRFILTFSFPPLAGRE